MFDELLADLPHLSNSKFNRLMLQVIKQRAARIQPHILLKDYRQNRFVGSVDLDPIQIRESELKQIKMVQEHGFTPIDFSHLTPLGTASGMAPVDQMHVISAFRNLEVVSDVTNVMALEAAVQRRSGMAGPIQICSAMQHIRGQLFEVPGWTPFFRVLAMCTAALDRGNLKTELDALLTHAGCYQDLLSKVFSLANSDLLFHCNLPIADEQQAQRIGLALRADLPFDHIQISTNPPKNNYYPSWTFGIQWKRNGSRYDLVDGGLVPWTQRLLQNKKERFLISGLGTEYLHRILNQI